MLTQTDNISPSSKNLYLKDFVPSLIVPQSYMVSVEELGEILSSPNRLKHSVLIYHALLIDYEKDTIDFVPKKFYQFPLLFGEKSILGRIFFSEKALPDLSNDYLKKLEDFLTDYNNEKNLLGVGFQESYLFLSKVSNNITTSLGHLDDPNEGVAIWIS